MLKVDSPTNFWLTSSDFEDNKITLNPFLVGPELQPYGQMIKAGFQDTANPRQESHEDFDDKVFMTTFENAINSW